MPDTVKALTQLGVTHALHTFIAEFGHPFIDVRVLAISDEVTELRVTEPGGAPRFFTVSVLENR